MSIDKHLVKKNNYGGYQKVEYPEKPGMKRHSRKNTA